MNRMIPGYRPFILTLALLIGGLTQPAFGVALTVNNAGFEGQALAPQDATGNSITGWSLHDPLNGVTTGFQWGALNPSGAGGNTFGVNTGYISNSAAEGSNVAYLFCCADNSNNAEFAIEQTLSATFTANTQYNLSVEVGNQDRYSDFEALAGQRLDGFPGYRVELLAGNTVIGVDNDSVAIADGGFGTSNVSVTFAEGDPALSALSGQNLRIRLWNLGADPGNDPNDGEADGFEVDFDDVAINTFAGPTADADGPYSFSATNLSVTLDGSGSTDPDNDIATYAWAIGATQVAPARCRPWTSSIPAS